MAYSQKQHRYQSNFQQWSLSGGGSLPICIEALRKTHAGWQHDSHVSRVSSVSASRVLAHYGSARTIDITHIWVSHTLLGRTGRYLSQPAAGPRSQLARTGMERVEKEWCRRRRRTPLARVVQTYNAYA